MTNISVHYIYISNLFMQRDTETVLSQDNNKVTFFKFVVSMELFAPFILNTSWCAAWINIEWK
jgi:hypothetical protein